MTVGSAARAASGAIQAQAPGGAACAGASARVVSSVIRSSKCVKPCRASQAGAATAGRGAAPGRAPPASPQGASRGGVPGISSMPPSRPLSGRRRSSQLPSRSNARKWVEWRSARRLRRLPRQPVLDAASCARRPAQGQRRAGRPARRADRGAEVEQRLGEVPGRARAPPCSIQRWASASRRRFAPGSGIGDGQHPRRSRAPHCRRSEPRGGRRRWRRRRRPCRSRCPGWRGGPQPCPGSGSRRQRLRPAWRFRARA
jgi:hypothetical protein